MTDFSYLKTWLQNGHRPVVLECQVSRSGLSMSVYERDRLFCRVNGCEPNSEDCPAMATGWLHDEALGVALAIFLEQLFREEIAAAELPKGSILSQGKPSQTLQGQDGLVAMARVADAIGLSVQVHETRSATLLIIQRKPS